jgi:cytochrome c
MARSARRWGAIVAGAVLTAPLLTGTPVSAHPGHEHNYQLLVFTKNSGAHSSTSKGVNAVRNLATNNGYAVDVAQNSTVFTDENLANYDAVVFLNTTGDVLNSAQEAAFERYVQNGGGYVGVHGAIEAEPSWTFYRDLVGTSANGAPAAGSTLVNVADRVHPSTASVSREVAVTDKFYNFSENVRGKVHVLATIDESRYTGGSMGWDHPISWCQDYQGGRSWYTGLGGEADTFTLGAFRKHLLGGIDWAAGKVEGDCGATVAANYEKVILNDEPGEPMSLAVLPDGRVLHNTRAGQIRLYDPATGASPVINTIPVYQNSEDGLQSVTLDPNFAENKWVYLYYAPPLDTPVGSAPATSDDPTVWDRWKGYNLLSRVKFVEEPTPHLDMSTEQEILRVETDRGTCCHVGGEVKFDGKGLLYLSTGDNTNASGSDGYTPINESPTQAPSYDAQRSAANTNDLRGKILRIKVKEDGSYSIPAGNLFPESQDVDNKTRPEIFLMGLRNPFRFDVDEKGFVYIGDYSPDSQNPNPDRGPEGTGRWIATNKAGNFGWPHCYSPTLPYIDYDFATRTSKGPFNCAAPVNDSPRNTGLTVLPPVQQPQFWYTFQARTPCGEAYLGNPTQPCDFKWPVIGTGGVGPMGGPIYKYDENLDSPYKWPAYFHNAVVFGEFSRDKMFMMHTNGSGKLLGVEQVLGHLITDNPMDMEFGPDGSLYLLEYGDGFFRANPDAALSVIRYVKGTRAPVAELDASPTNGQAPLTVNFSSEGSYSPEPGVAITYAWDFDGDGTTDSTEPNPSFTYTTNGFYTAKLTVTDSSGKTAVLTREITVGNTAPTVRITSPISGSFYNWGDTVDWSVTVTDPEDETIDCSRVKVSMVLGHDTHGHGLEDQYACSGSFTIPADGGDHASGYLFMAFSATYTDLGANGVPALSDTHQVVLQRRQQEAEQAQIQQGVTIANTNDVATGPFGPGQHVSGIDNNDHIAFEPINLGDAGSVTFRYAGGSAATAGQPRAAVEVRVGSPTGTLVGTAVLPATSGTSNWASYTMPIDHPVGSDTVYLVFKSVSGGPTTSLFNLNWVKFDPKNS